MQSPRGESIEAQGERWIADNNRPVNRSLVSVAFVPNLLFAQTVTFSAAKAQVSYLEKVAALVAGVPHCSAPNSIVNDHRISQRFFTGRPIYSQALGDAWKR
jgi:hypothetical protein